jgi:hypothetical protein
MSILWLMLFMRVPGGGAVNKKRTEIKDLGSLVETDHSISWLLLAQQPLPQQVLCH